MAFNVSYSHHAFLPVRQSHDMGIRCRAAAAFYYSKDGPIAVAYISDAYRLLSPAVGTVAAKIIFGIALLASGQNSTITGTLAGDLLFSQPLTSMTCFDSRWSCLIGEWSTCRASGDGGIPENPHAAMVAAPEYQVGSCGALPL